MPFVRWFALILGIVGGLLFGFAFVASAINPGFVEQLARNIIRYEVERKVQEKIEAIDKAFLSSKAAVFAKGYAEDIEQTKRFLKGYAEDIEQTKRFLTQQLPTRLAKVIAEMRDLDCECRKKIETNIRDGFEWRIASASSAHERLTTLIRSKYMDTATQLTREFRIFTGTNAIVFALLLVAVFVKRQAGLHLLPSALVLLAAGAITAYFYLFNQNWLHSLVFNEYVGLAYIGYLAGAFALLCDIILNRARLTTEVLNFVLNAIGSAIQVVPC